MSWDIFGGDDQMFEDDFALYKAYKAREQARFGGSRDRGGSEDSIDPDCCGFGSGGGHYVGRASGGLPAADKTKSAPAEAADPKAEALYRLNFAESLVLNRNRARVKLIIYCLVTGGIGLYMLVSTNYDAAGILVALLMLACIIGVIWAYKTQHGDADEYYERCLEQYNEAEAKERRKDAESKKAADN